MSDVLSGKMKRGEKGIQLAEERVGGEKRWDRGDSGGKGEGEFGR